MPTQSPVHDSVRPAYTVGVTGRTESGKTTLLLALCRLLRDTYNIAAVTRQPAPGVDSGRAFLLRHKALAPTRIVAVDDANLTDLATAWLMTEFRPELIFVEDAGADCETDTLPDFTIHVVNGSGDTVSSDDVIGVSRSDLLVLNKTHLGPPLDVERDVCVREALRLRGDAPYVFAQIRYGIGTIDIAKQFLARWRQANAPAAWTQAEEGSAALTPV